MAQASTSVKKRDEYCCVPMCNGNARTNPDLSFHHIPTEKRAQIRKQWIIAIRRDEGPLFKIGKNTVVCSRHFTKDDFRWTLNRKCLHSNAVPSVFQWKLLTPTRKSPRKRLAPAPTPSDISDSDHQEQDVDMVPIESTDSQPLPDVDQHAACKVRIVELEQENEQLMEKMTTKEQYIQGLERKLRIEKFGVTRFLYDNDMIEFYTGFPSYTLFNDFLQTIRPTASRMKTAYYQPSEEITNRGRKSSTDPVDECFMFLCRLKCGFLEEDLSVRFGISKSTVSRKLISWTNYLYFLLGSICIWPSKEKILEEAEVPMGYPNVKSPKGQRLNQ